MDILLSNINKTYSGGNRVIFETLDAVFRAGQISVILGKSGSGKSSLLNLMAGIDLPDSGSIRIGETEITKLHDTQRSIFRRKHVGFVFQSFNLIPVLTVMENITLVSQLDNRPRGECLDRAKSLLDTVGLLDRQNEFPDRLSGGEQQRVALARALVNQPEIILADEPTGNLDARTGAKMLNLITSQARRLGKTLIMVTHSRDAMDHADQVFRVQENQLIPGEEK